MIGFDRPPVLITGVPWDRWHPQLRSQLIRQHGWDVLKSLMLEMGELLRW